MRSNHGLVNRARLGRARPPATGHGQLRVVTRRTWSASDIYFLLLRRVSRSPFLSSLPPVRGPRVCIRRRTWRLAARRRLGPGSVPRFKNKLTPASARADYSHCRVGRCTPDSEAGLSRAAECGGAKSEQSSSDNNRHRRRTLRSRRLHTRACMPGPLPLARSLELRELASDDVTRRARPAARAGAAIRVSVPRNRLFPSSGAPPLPSYSF